MLKNLFKVLQDYDDDEFDGDGQKIEKGATSHVMQALNSDDIEFLWNNSTRASDGKKLCRALYVN